ncbi:MAG: hypothetical protein HQ559_08825 [Lentisphaerae bacterium]|nr:hypothetical protein [Lentisphaerota bacterium]
MKIENRFYVVEIDESSGVVTSLFDKAGDLELISDARIGETFRLLLPLPHCESNYVVGNTQDLTAIERSGDGLAVKWAGPMKTEQGSYPVAVTLRIELVDESVQFRLDVVNDSELEIAEAWYPMLGGITGVGNRMDTRTLIQGGGRTQDPDIFQTFREAMGIGGGGGNRYPEYYLSYPGTMSVPWIDIYNEKLGRGIYIGCHDTTTAFGALRLEQRPGIAHNVIGDNWPRPEEQDDRVPEGILMGWVKFPYTRAGETYCSPPVVIQCHAGDWHAGAPIYRRWFDANFKRVDPRRSWIHRAHAFQDILSLLPEGNVILPFKKIAQVARDGLDYGVRSLMVSSWNLGGHDNLYPHYTPDPRLGTWDDLGSAIEECHDMGVKVYMFVNLQPVDIDNDWYREELHKYLARDKWGVPAAHAGWGMGTLGARMGLTRRPQSPANAAIPEYRKIIVDQMRKLAEIGADGLHFDKLCWHPGLDFNPLSPVGPDLAGGDGILLAMREVLETCREVNPDFQLSCESAWDRLLEYSDVAWAWHCELDHVAALRYTFSQWTPMMPVVQPYDFNVVNNATRYGYQIMVGTARFSKSMQDEPMQPLSKYIQEVLRIREELEDTIYYGEFLDRLEADVDTHDDVRWNTHRNPDTGQRACVLANLGHEPRQATVRFDGGSRPLQIHVPFREVMTARQPATIAIEPRRLAVVKEV